MNDTTLHNEQPLSDFVYRLINEYPVEKKKDFANNSLGEFIRKSVPKSIYNANIIDPNIYKITGSVGIGNWANIPWLAIFDKNITESAEKGVYIVYLLSMDNKTLYLTLNQGCSELKKRYGKNKTIEILKKLVDKRQKELSKDRNFDTLPIKLNDPNAPKKDDKATMYEAGCFLSKAYTIDNLPTEQILREDLNQMVDIYKDYAIKYWENDSKIYHNSPKVWLLSWNPDKWQWSNYAKCCSDTKEGKAYVEDWTCQNTHTSIGDEVFLMKLGDSPRGIIGYGIVNSDGHKEPHFDLEKAAQGIESNHIQAKYVQLQNYLSEHFLKWEVLKEKFPEQTWTPNASGIEIEPINVDLDELRKMWNDVTKDQYKEESLEMSNNKNFPLNMILYGPPGTGKTFDTAAYAVAICDNKSLEEVKAMDRSAVKEKFEELKGQGRIEFLTFHQSYSYEEFIEGIKPDTDNSNLKYDKEDGVFKKFCQKARETINEASGNEAQIDSTSTSNKPQNYVFIIDEINRGNISKIFGELITLIEATKREGADDEASATLPYTGEPFSVPKNVYILGTMNTADRSIALLDTALRRRFDFIEKMPQPELLDDVEVRGNNNSLSVNIGDMLRKINDRIEFLFDREHTIGHAFFWELKSNPSINVLADIFKRSVIPLLQEYFYDDYEKIQLVLGDNGKEEQYKFIKDVSVVPNELFIGHTKLEKSKKYLIQEDAFKHIESYVGITTVVTKKAEKSDENSENNTGSN